MENKQIVSVVNLRASAPPPAFPKVALNKSTGIVTIGSKNMFPQEIIDINSKSPVNTAIIHSTATYVCGNGVRMVDGSNGKLIASPSVSESWNSLLWKVALDYKTFGGYYMQVVLNNDGVTVSLFHQDYSTVRIGQIDEKGNILTFKISNDWTKTSGKYAPVELKAWSGVEEMQKGEAYLFHHYRYMPGLMFYSMPDYYAAIEYIKADGLLGSFYRNTIDNGFMPSVIITMPSNPDNDVKEAFQRAIEEAFCGANGAGRALTIWGENGEVAAKITPFNASGNADVYNNVESIIFQKIISANRLSSPTLAGVSGGGNLSGNAAEIVDAFILYNYTVIEQMRRDILSDINIFTLINGTATLAIEDLDVVGKIAEAKDPSATMSTDQGGGANATVEALASRLGVGGTQALTDVMSSDMPEQQKRGLLRVLFGLSDADIDLLFS